MTTQSNFGSHSVELMPGENLFDARRRWMATAPKGCLSPIYIL